MSVWQDWWQIHKETLGVGLTFAAIGSALSLIANKRLKEYDSVAVRALVVFVAGQFIGAAAMVVVHGILGWHVLLAPVVGGLSGVGGVIVINSLIRAFYRVEDKVTDIVDKGIAMLPGQKKD